MKATMSFSCWSVSPSLPIWPPIMGGSPVGLIRVTKPWTVPTKLEVGSRTSGGPRSESSGEGFGIGRGVGEVDGVCRRVPCQREVRGGEVPGVVEVHDLLEALGEAVVEVRLYEVRGRPQVHVARGRGLEQPVKLREVAQGGLEEEHPIGRRIGVSTETEIDEVGPQGVKPQGIGRGIGLLVEGVQWIPRDADVGEAVHGERVFALQDGLQDGEARGRVTCGALGIPEEQLPPVLLGRGQRVLIHRWHSESGGVVLRAELVDLGRVLERRDRGPDQNIELLRGVFSEYILAIHPLEQVGVRPCLDLLDDERGKRVGRGSEIGVGHLVRIDEGIQRCAAESGTRPSRSCRRPRRLRRYRSTGPRGLTWHRSTFGACDARTDRERPPAAGRCSR